jgi:ATP dependent DNA ligase C terminal region
LSAPRSWDGKALSPRTRPRLTDRSGRPLAENQNRHQEKFPVIGFVKDPTGVAALCLGKREGKELVYLGKVGTGWSRTVSSKIRKHLDTVVSPKSKLTKQVKKPRATWVDPVFSADIDPGYHVRRLTPAKLVQRTEQKGTISSWPCFCFMTEPLLVLIEDSLQIAWDYLDGIGELADQQQTAEFLLKNIQSQMLRGERRSLMLSNRAIESYRKQPNDPQLVRWG